MTDASLPYHRGDLPTALLEAASALLEEGGIEALTLRSITRRAGVSATAAVPHFGSLAGLRTALAANGYNDLADALQAAASRGAMAVGMAYIGFALDYPGLYRLMFLRPWLDMHEPVLSCASGRAFRALGALVENTGEEEALTPRMAALWARVHGLAMLAIDDMLTPFYPGESREDIRRFLQDTLSVSGKE